MKQFQIIFFFVLMFLTFNSYSQFREFDLSKLDIDGKPTRILITALWCSPCMAKYKQTVEEFKKDSLHNNLVLFDATNFTRKNVDNILANSYDSFKIFILPNKYYGKGIVVINVQQKAMNKFLKDMKIKFPMNDGLKDFGYGDILSINEKNFLSLKKAEH